MNLMFQHSRASALLRLAEARRELSELAAEGDQRGGFPSHSLELLRRLGVLEAFAGLAEPEADTLLEALRGVGRADLSLGRIFEGHVNAVRLIDGYGDAAQKHRLAEDLAAKRLFGVWATEPPPGVRVIPAGETLVLAGAKSFATGCLGLERAIITVQADGEKRLLVVPITPQRADVGGWKTRGMRATGSGLYDFTGVVVSQDMWLGQAGDYEREPRFTGGAWRFTAVQLGAVERLVMLLREHLRQGGGHADPVQRRAFALAVAAARTAGLWVRQAAAMTEQGRPEAVGLTLMTRGVVEQAGLKVMEIAARAIGTRSFFADQEVDRITRDLGLYLRQAQPDQAVDRAAAAWLETDGWGEDPWW
jgi:alkylation response protein AidB-like acyl-CoA dehydrogenase